MASLPRIVIVGRPNVGKSTLFNRLVGRRAAVVSDREGVTRDRHFQETEIGERRVQLVDTGGFLPNSEEGSLNDSVRQQILVAVEEADLVLFVTDALLGVSELDLRFSRVIQKTGRPVLAVCNKAEKLETRQESWQFAQLGLGEVAEVSALRGYGLNGLTEDILELLPESGGAAAEENANIPKFAILGRPNAGKSTLVNRLLGENRMVVSDRPGTTRDSIDVRLMHGDTEVLLTDTAGLRKKARVSNDVEYFSNMRALESIRRSEVVLLVIDSVRGMEQQDFRIAEQVRKAGRGLLIILNKWDLIDKDHKTFDQTIKILVQKAPFLEHVPFLSISALEGQRVTRLLDKALAVHENCFRVMGRDALVDVFQRAVEANPHPARETKKVRIDRCCQILVNPPVVAIETTQPKLVDESWKRYFLRILHQNFEFDGAPLRLNFDRQIRLRKDEELAAVPR